jgi:hypothetical protein
MSIIGSKATITSLATETLYEISKYLCPHCTYQLPTWSASRHDLSNLSKTCRRLCSIAQPTLFHCFCVIGQPQRPINNFIHTLMIRPDLARSVKAVIFITLRPLTLNRLFNAENMIRDGHRSLPKILSIDHGPYRNLHLVELVIGQCPNLETLRLPV